MSDQIAVTSGITSPQPTMFGQRIPRSEFHETNHIQSRYSGLLVSTLFVILTSLSNAQGSRDQDGAQRECKLRHPRRRSSRYSTTSIHLDESKFDKPPAAKGNSPLNLELMAGE